MPNQTGQSIDAVIDGLMGIAQTAYGATLDTSLGVWTASRNGQRLAVVEGALDAYQPDLAILVATAIRQPIERPTMGSTRSRERAAEVDIVFSAFTPGAPGSALPAARRACNDLINAFEDYFRVMPQETLADACREAWVSNIDGPNPSQSAQVDGVLGYLSEATVTITAKIRY